ncbi:MAG: fused MFS/spermidine synthase [Victivallales bacterium]|nr:fused MFS/spermidine synthase [Victivallales bacterium]
MGFRKLMVLVSVLFACTTGLPQCLSGGGEGSAEPFKMPEVSFWQHLWSVFLPRPPNSNVVYHQETEYFDITVEDDESGFRHLVFNPRKGSQGYIRFEAPEEVHPKFMQFSFLSLAAFEAAPCRVLFIGLGAGIMPMFMRRVNSDVRMTVVELDAAIQPISERFFGFHADGGMDVVISDGRVFVNRSKETFDIIFIDAFNHKEIPFHLTTVEFFKNISRCLAPRGVMVANIANFGDVLLLHSQLATVREVFPNVAVFISPGQTNFIVLASNDNPLDGDGMLRRAQELDREHRWNFKLEPFMSTRIPDEVLKMQISGARIITDDFAPLNP